MNGARNTILLTQRVDVISSYSERRDALDQQWMTLLSNMGCDGFAASNNASLAERQARRLSPDLIVLTGGNDIMPGNPDYAPERNETEAVLLKWAADNKVPVLAVCRGFQFMNLHFGGSLSPVDGHVATTHTTSSESDGIGVVNSFHKFGIKPADLSDRLLPTVFADDGTIEAARHVQLPWTGIMWHPERPMPDANGSDRWFANMVKRLAHSEAPFEID